MPAHLMRLMKLHRLYRAPAGDGGSDDGGGKTAEQIAAEKAAADKAAADEAARKAAEEAAKNKPSDAEAALIKDVMKQKEARQAAEAKLVEIQKQLEQFTGIDPVKVKALLQQQEEEERKKLEAKGEYERLTAQMAERHKEETAALRKQIEDAQAGTAGLQRQIAEITVGSSFTGSKFVSEELTLTPAKARVVYGTHFEFKDGKVVGYDKPTGASDRTVLVDSTGNPLAFDEALKKIVEADPDKDHLIRSKARPGANSNSSKANARAADAGGDGKKELTSIEKIAAGLKAIAKK
jgi:hypothetical protein